MRIDVHADDYALSLNTSMDILQAIKANKLDSISILPNMVCFEECLVLWKQLQCEQKMPKISIHLNFVEGHCCADCSQVDSLIDSNGYLARSWGELFKFSLFYGTKRREIKQQFKSEIRAQISKIMISYDIKGGLRIDSHQHTHMLPIIFDALNEVILEENYKVEYIRDTHDLFSPYLGKFSLYNTYRPINMVKVMLLNIYSLKHRKRIRTVLGKEMYLSGVFLSGKMDENRIEKILPSFITICDRSNHNLELLFHPGTLLKEETGPEFINLGAVDFYQSENRDIEWKALMQHKYWGERITE